MPPFKKPRLPKVYDPSLVEKRIYNFWLDKGFFSPKVDRSKKPFVMIQPPPNVTGELHLGHALTAAIEDTIVRWHRMLGEPTLWLPGKDHASIATHWVVEREIAKEGLTRYQLGRKMFLKRVRQWVDKYGTIIDNQHKRLGTSQDWSRLRFTMDTGPSRAVHTTFFNLYNKKLVYRGERLINWCPRCDTALSDLEVEHDELHGQLYYIRYPLEEGEHITIATTRPETMLGDTGVAVSPNDKRYNHLVGKHAVLPIIGRTLPIIADNAIDPQFGTGALKVTPGHDPVDFDIGKRHNLSTVTVIARDGTMTDNAGPYAGDERFEVRKKIVERLEHDGLLEKVESYQHSVGHCQRCKTIVEPLVSIQWFIKSKPLADPAIEAVEKKRISIVPRRFTKVYLHWMKNIRDWCISRQLWWGHRIPVWYCLECDGEKIQATVKGHTSNLRQLLKKGLSLADIDNSIERVSTSIHATPIVAVDPPQECPKCYSKELFQDPDVLDTWFSSGLWTHSTLGWSWKPEDWDSPDHYQSQKNDLDYFYPTNVMETGYDILFFWVARMIMLGLENMGREPFDTIFLHGLILDEQGVKMSKTKGNVLDPLKLIDIYGADALRFALTTGTSPGNNLRLGKSKLEASRNFANKLWNASRFLMGNLDDRNSNVSYNLKTLSHREDLWILSRLHNTIDQTNKYLNQHELGQAQQTIHDFVWHEFCDWYIEMAKVRLRYEQDPSPLPILAHVLEHILRLLHPFMPFITEELWQNLMPRLTQDHKIPKSIMVAPYPLTDKSLINLRTEDEMSQIISLIHAVRNIRSQLRIAANLFIEANVQCGEHRQLIEDETRVIQTLARIKSLSLDERGNSINEDTLTLVVGKIVVNLPLGKVVDLPLERQRLENELTDSRGGILRLQELLSKDSFKTRAPAEVVKRQEDKLNSLMETQQRLNEILSQISRR